MIPFARKTKKMPRRSSSARRKALEQLVSRSGSSPAATKPERAGDADRTANFNTRMLKKAREKQRRQKK